MKSPNAISPTTGSRIGSDDVYPQGRDTLPHQSTGTPIDGTGELTKGETKSSRVALQQYWEDCYERSHAGRAPPAAVARRAGFGLYQLKREDPIDLWAWFALQEWLAREGYWSTWMREHVAPKCPRCGSRLQIEQSLVGLDFAACGSRCGADSASERSVEIVDRVIDLYNRTFPAEPSEHIETLVTV